MSGRVCSGWEMLRPLEVEEIVNENRKKLKAGEKLEARSGVEFAEIICSAIPDELVEKIVASMPYPYILDARILSKAWHWRLSSMSLDNAGFQETLRSISCKWHSYFPLVFSRSKGFLACFDRSNRRWMRIFLGASELEAKTREMKVNQPPWKLAAKVGGAGSLMYGLSEDLKIFVCNIFTGAWKWLPEGHRMEGSFNSLIYMFLDGPDNYKVLKMTASRWRRDGREVCTQLYESKSNSWSMKLSTVNSSPVDCNGVYLNGVVYFSQYNIATGMLEVWAYNIEKGSWHPIPHPLVLMLHTFRTFKLLRCQDELVLVLRLKRASSYDDGPERPRIRMNSLIFYKLDPVTEKFSEVYRGPQKAISGASSSLYVSEGYSIYFGKLRKESRYLVEFNIRTCTWNLFPASSCIDLNLVYASFGFQPGKNPFIAV